MAVTLPVTPNRHQFSGVATSWTRLTPFTLPGSAQHLVILLTMRAYAAGATRNLTVTWCGSEVTVKSTSLLGTITAQEDFHYWLGVIANPDVASSPNLSITADGSIRGMYATLYFADGADPTVPVIVHASQARASSGGNTVTLTGTPARAGGIMVSATGTQYTSTTTVTSFTPSSWTVDYAGGATNTLYHTINIARDAIASTAGITTVTQFGVSDVNRGGVLFEIQAAAASGGLTETASPSDSVGTPVVAASLGLTETASASDATTAVIPSNTTPENPSGVWTGATASWKLPSGIDSKGNVNLTVSSLPAVTIKGPGATFTTASYARRTAPALGTPGNITAEFWVKPTTFGHLVYIGPRASGTNIARVWLDANGAWNMLRTVGAATQSAKSANGAAVLGATYHVAAVFASGQDHRLYVNGELVTLTMTGAAVTGALAIGSDDEVALGDPTLASLAGFAGDMGRVTLWPLALSASRIKASYRQQNNLAQWVGVSGENASSDTNRAPAAVPMQETLTGGVAKTIDVIARAYDPDGDALSIQSGSLVPSTGSASIVSGQVSWTPPASFAGAATCGFTLRDGGGKSSSSTIYGTVSASPPPPGDFPRDPPAALRTLRVPSATYATLAAAHAVAIPGDHIEFESGSYGAYGLYDNTVAGENSSLSNSNHFVWTKAGTAANPIVLKSRNAANAVMVWHLDISAQHVWLNNLTFRRSGTNPSRIKGGRNDNYTSALMSNWNRNTNPNYSVRLGASNTKVTNCLIESSNGICVPSSSSNIDICYNDFQCRTLPIWAQANGLYLGAFGPTSRGSDNVLIARNKWWNDLDFTNNPDTGGDGRYCVYTGNNEPQDNKTGVNRTVRFIENFVEVSTIKTGWYLKRDYYHLRNFIRMGSSGTPAFNQRHGGYSNSGGTAFSDITDDKIGLVVGCNFDRGIARFNDGPRLVVSCRMGSTTELYYGGRRTSGSTLANYTISGIPPGYTQAASDMEFVGCSFVGNMRAGEDEGTSSKPWKVWGAAEQTRWGNGEPTQGDTIKRVKVYAAGVTSPAQPTEDNGKFERITNRYGETTVAAGTAGFQSLSGDNGRTALLQPYVTRAELEFTTGCDAP